MKNETVEKLVANLHDQTEYVIHIRNVKQTLSHGLDFKKSSQSDLIYSKWLVGTIY